jgi:hypothetical protein
MKQWNALKKMKVAELNELPGSKVELLARLGVHPKTDAKKKERERASDMRSLTKSLQKQKERNQQAITYLLAMGVLTRVVKATRETPPRKPTRQNAASIPSLICFCDGSVSECWQCISCGRFLSVPILIGVLRSLILMTILMLILWDVDLGTVIASFFEHQS